jgi:hypothetical protein
MMIGGAAGLREACITASATSASGPAAKRCGPMKAVNWGRVWSAMDFPGFFRCYIYPDKFQPSISPG